MIASKGSTSSGFKDTLCFQNQAEQIQKRVIVFFREQIICMLVRANGISRPFFAENLKYVWPAVWWAL